MHEVKFCVRINIKFQSTHESIRLTYTNRRKDIEWLSVLLYCTVCCFLHRVDRIILKLTKSIIDNRFDLIKQILRHYVIRFIAFSIQFCWGYKKCTSSKHQRRCFRCIDKKYGLNLLESLEAIKREYTGGMNFKKIMKLMT